MVSLAHYDESEVSSALFAAVNHVILPHRHAHRLWEYPRVLQAMSPLHPDETGLCVGGMWDSLALWLAGRQKRLVVVDPTAINLLVCWFGDPTPKGCELLSGTAEEVIPRYFGPGEFDVAFAVSVLEHCSPQARRAIWAEMRRVARRCVVATVDFALTATNAAQLSYEDIEHMIDSRLDCVQGKPPPAGGWAPACITWVRDG